MRYFSKSLYHSANKKHAEYGTADSISSEKGTDNKKNNTSEYNHEYYMRNKKKWDDSSKDSDGKSSDSEKEFDVDAAAMDVIRGKYKNGEERKKLLGEDYAIVQKRVNELMKTSSAAKDVSKQTSEQKKETRTFDEAKEDYNKKKKENAQSAAKAATEKGKKQTEYYKKKTVKHYDNIGSILISDLD